MNFYASMQCSTMQSLKMKEGRDRVREGRREETFCEHVGSDFQDPLLHEKSYGTVYKSTYVKWRGHKNIHM